tara:strand:- start:274 stop:678 length:405 start_codon:yes stop_codon:yes gene_type:complete
MQREDMLMNYYMIKESGAILTGGYGAYRGSKGKSEGERASRRRFSNLTEDDLDDIREESMGGGTGALRGIGYGGLGALGGALVTGGSLGGAVVGGLAYGGYKAHTSKAKAKRDFLERARRKSESKELDRLRRRR